MKAKAPESSQKNIEDTQPYPPSYVDRFMLFIKRQSVPYWLTCLALFILQGTLNHVHDWTNGWSPAFTFHPVFFTFPLWLWAPLVIMTYLDSTALKAVSNFGPLLDLSPEATWRLKYEFTTMPARGAIVSGLVWTVLYIPYTYVNIPLHLVRGVGALGITKNIIEGWLCFVVGFAIFYHTIRQLRLVQHTVKLVKQVDLFRLERVYAFSVLTSRTGVAWVLLLVLTRLTVPLDYSGSFIAVSGVGLVITMALAAFALPLWDVHQRLVAEKHKLLEEHDQRIKSTLTRLHHSVDENKLSDVSQLHSVLEGLNIERNILEKIRTWPWRTETLTGFLSAIVLPIILLIIQIVVQEWLL